MSPLHETHRRCRFPRAGVASGTRRAAVCIPGVIKVRVTSMFARRRAPEPCIRLWLLGRLQGLQIGAITQPILAMYTCPPTSAVTTALEGAPPPPPAGRVLGAADPGATLRQRVRAAVHIPGADRFPQDQDLARCHVIRASPVRYGRAWGQRCRKASAEQAHATRRADGTRCPTACMPLGKGGCAAQGGPEGRVCGHGEGVSRGGKARAARVPLRPWKPPRPRPRARGNPLCVCAPHSPAHFAGCAAREAGAGSGVRARRASRARRSAGGGGPPLRIAVCACDRRAQG